MEFRFSPEQEAFRQEVRAWLDENLPEETRLDASGHPEAGEFLKRLGEKGWIGLAWPKEYGGQGRSFLEQLVYAEEMAYRRAPMGNMTLAINVVGPSLIAFGSEQHKREFLPRILRAEISFCLGYTEPEAGSDLASLKTRALEDGDDFVINGMKIFITGAERADYMWTAVRTDPDAPPHRGVSLIIIPMDRPGITIRPLWTIADLRTNLVNLEDVRVPRDMLVGEKNRGFYHMAVALDFERVMIGGSVQRTRRLLEELTEFAQTTEWEGKRLVEHGWVAEKLVDLWTDLEVATLLAYRTVWLLQNGRVPNTEASMSKLFTGLYEERVAHFGTQILGLYGKLRPESPWAPLAGRVEHAVRTSLLSVVGGGSAEIQKNIIAQRGLGLPR